VDIAAPAPLEVELNAQFPAWMVVLPPLLLLPHPASVIASTAIVNSDKPNSNERTDLITASKFRCEDAAHLTRATMLASRFSFGS
jgi:hypothetical protein